MKKILLSALLCVGAMSISAQNTADFDELTATTSYKDFTTPAGWTGSSCAVMKGGEGNNPAFSFIADTDATKAPTLNGGKNGSGKITSPTLNGGISTLSFNYGLPFYDISGVKLKIDIKKDGEVIATETLENTSVAQKTKYTFTSKAFDIEGDFVIEISNLLTSTSNNANRTSIWNLTWTSFGEGPAVATPVIDMVEQGEGFVVTMSCATEGAEIRYTEDETTPTAESTLYTAPLECWGPTTYKAVAVKDGELSNVATFTANPPYILEGFSNLYDDFGAGMEPGQKVPVIIKGAMTAIYQNSNYLFVKDSMASYMLVYGNGVGTLNNGDTFERLEGNFEIYNDQPEISSPSIVGDITPGTAVEPEELANLSLVVDKNLNHYVFIENVAVSGVNGKKATLTDAEGNTCAIFNRFNIDLADAAGCKVVGFVTKNNGAMQIWPTEIIAAAGVVAVPTFNPESGATIPMYSEITISAEEGAEIYCMVEGYDDDFRLYEGPEPAYPAGELIIKAFAKKGEAVSETVTATYTVTKPSPELRWLDADYNPVKEVVYVIDGDASQQLLPRADGMMEDPILTSSNPEVATITEMMGIEVKSVGETTITISVEESAMYAAGSASFVLKVISKAEASQISAIVDFSNTVNDVDFTASAKEQTWESTDGNYQFNATAAVGQNSTYPAVTDSQLRLYGSSDNTIKVAAPTGYHIKEVSFNVDQNGQNWLPTVNNVDASVASRAAGLDVANAVNCGVSLPTAISEVTIGCGGSTKHIRINNITFTLTEAASGIESIASEAADGAAEYYNLQGVRVENPEAGLYIRRQGGKVAKVIIR